MTASAAAAAAAAALPPSPPPSTSENADSPATHPSLRTNQQRQQQQRGTTPSGRPRAGSSPRSARHRRRRRSTAAAAAAAAKGGADPNHDATDQQHPKEQQHDLDFYDDDGMPSHSITDDLHRSLHLIYDERHLVAYDLYRDAVGRLEELAGSGNGDGNSDAAPGTNDGAATANTSPTRRNIRVPPLSPFLRRRAAGNAATSAGGQQDGGGVGVPDENDRRVDWERAKMVLQQNEEEFNKLEKRAKLFLRAKQNLTIDDDWIKAQTLFGITTYYRREPDGSLSIKLEGHLSGIPLFEQLVVLRESDLYHEWAPFCVASARLAQLGKIDVVAWFLTGLPKFGISRDACYRAIGCDSMKEDGSVLLVGEGLGDRVEDGVDIKPYLDERTEAEMRASAAATAAATTAAAAASALESESSPKNKRKRKQQDLSGPGHDSSNVSNWGTLSDEYEHGSYLSRDSVLDTIQLPPVPDKFGAGRLTIRSFQGVIDVLSPTSARTRLVTNIDPNLRFVPQSLIDFCMKKMCGILLSRLQGAARGVIRDPVHSLHARRMREDAQFYRLWLLPKFRAYCEDLGWEMPPVAAFNVKEEDLDEEEWLLYSQLNQDAPEPTVRRARSDGALGEGREAASADTSPTSRRLFQTQQSAPERSVVSEAASRKQGEPMRLFGDGGTRTKLRQLLPSESMEISLTSPDLLARWEQHQARKKAVAVASARRKAALRLRPAPPNEEQAKRLAQLQEAKTRFLAGKSGGGGSKSIASNQGDAAPRGVVAKVTDTPARSFSTFLEVVSFTHPRIPHKVLLPCMLIVMFIIYHADNGLLSRLTEPVAERAYGSNIQYLFREIAREATFFFVLAVYGVAHWAVLNLALIVAYDFIELSLLSLAGTRRELRNAKALYASNIRPITAYMTLTIIGVALGSSLLSYFWSYIVLTLLPTEIPNTTEILFSVFHAPMDKIEATLPFDIASMVALVSTLTASLTNCARFVSSAFAFSANVLLNVWHFISRGWFVGFGIGTKEWIGSCIAALANSIFAVDETRFAWRSATLHKSRMLMSYSAAFLISLITIAHVIFPKSHVTKKTKQTAGNDARDHETVSMNQAVMDGSRVGFHDTVATMTTAGGMSSFSLASGGLPESSSSGQNSLLDEIPTSISSVRSV